MNIIKILISLAFVIIIFVVEKLAIYSKIPGFVRVEKLYLSQQDICGSEMSREFSTALSSVLFSEKLLGEKLGDEVISSCRVISPTGNFKVVTAKVVFVPHEVFPEEIIIDAGENLGVKKYSLVVKSGSLFGRVIEVGEDTSRVLTIFSSRFFVDSFLLKEGGRVILKGGSNGKLEVFASMGKVSLFEDDIAVTAGTKFNLPFGLRIGEVTPEGKVKPFVTLSDLIYLSVIVPEDGGRVEIEGKKAEVMEKEKR